VSRFVREQTPPIYTNHEGYRPFLRIDFRERCAYCERTEAFLRGQDFFTVDHFRPKSKFPDLALHYPNLYYACGKCNQHKGSTWPSEKLQKDGCRFSDPCEEDMYVEHLRELETGMLVPLDKCGDYTAAQIRLNRRDLVEWRQLKGQIIQELGRFDEILETLRTRLSATAEDAERDKISAEISLLERTTNRHRAELGLLPN
jgi:hypothetical protein